MNLISLETPKTGFVASRPILNGLADNTEDAIKS